MFHRSLIILTFCVSFAISSLVANHIGPYSIRNGYWTLIYIGLVPAKLAKSPITSYIITGAVLVFLLELGFRAWRRPSVIRTSVCCSLTLITAAIANVHAYAWHKHHYPYGWSHCCLTGLGGSLRLYSGDHNGKFPAGGSSPEASLSLLLTNYCDLYTLKGKTVDIEAAEAVFEQNGVLDSNTCGWYYVEGLTEGDNPEIAIVWDKIAGLGHNGQRLQNESRAVLYLDGHEGYIPASQWAEFLQHQQKLLAARPERLKQGLPPIVFKIRLPNGEIVDHYDGAFTLQFAGYTVTGTNLAPQNLDWYSISISQGTLSPSLTLPGMKSKPVEIAVSNWWPTVNEAIIEMEKTE
jgi:hypothetical protein